jgi:PD-(D/E)XK nuclease superfamily
MSLKRVQSRSVHEAQLATYLKLSGLQLGLLINSNVVPIKYGIRRRVTSR